MIKTAGENMRTRAVLLCKEVSFQTFMKEIFELKTVSIDDTIDEVYKQCGIKSRGWLATDKNAQAYFHALDMMYRKWKKPTVDTQYADNLSRY